MNKDKILRTLLPLLIVVSIFIWVRSISNLSRGHAPSAPQEAGEVLLRKGGQGGIRGVAVLSSKERKKSAYFKWGRNPFDMHSAQSDVTILNGILWDLQNPQAIINGEIVGIGSSVGIYTVYDIERDRVYLRSAEEKLELKWEEE